MKYVLGGRRKQRWLVVLLTCVVLLATSAGVVYVFLRKNEARAPYVAETVQPEQVRDVTYTAQIVFLGDTMLARTVGPAILRGEDPFVHVRPILNTYDVRVANIESVIADPAVATTPANKRYIFNAPLGVLPAMKGVPIDVSVLANNHTGDYGRAAMLDTIKNLDSAGLVHVGLGKDIDEAFKPLVVDVVLKADDTSLPDGSVKIAVIAFNDFQNQFSDADINLPGSAFFDKNRLAASIKSARDQGAELIFVMPHWGTEFKLDKFDTRQQELGRWLIDAGVDAVVGAHPHVIQPTEIYNGKPIVYSLGNFVFSGMESIPNTGRGQMAGFTITKVNQAAATLSEPRYHYYNLDLNGYPIPE